MADWFYYGNNQMPTWLTNIGQILSNVEELNTAIANMSLADAVQYIEQKRISGDPIAQQIIKWTENFADTEETETDTYVIGSVSQGGGGRSGGGGAGRRGSASEVWEEYDDEGGAVSIFGNAKETEEVIPYLVLLSKGNILSVGVQLFLPQSAAIAALLPYAGLATTEEFWWNSAEQALEIGTTLLEYTFKGIPIKGLVPAIMDLDRQIWVDNAMMEKLKAFTSKWINGIAKTTPFSEVTNLLPIRWVNASQGYAFFAENEANPQAFWGVKSSGSRRTAGLRIVSSNSSFYYYQAIVIMASETQFPYETYHPDTYGKTLAEVIAEFNSATGTADIADTPFTYDNKTVYWCSVSVSGSSAGIGAISNLGTVPYSGDGATTYIADRIKHIAWTMVYGETEIGELPTGITTSSEFTPSDESPSVLTNSSTYFLRNLAPVVLPPARPYVTSPSSPDTPSTDEAITPFLWPSVNQNEFVPYDPNEYPDMAYDPESATAPLPTPQNVPATQPVENPSSPGVPDISYDPSILDPPISGGISPVIGVPDPLDWPSAVPGDTSGTHNGDPGLIHVYNPSNTEMQNFGRWLWVTYNDVSLNKIFNNPFDGVIGAHELYATPASVGIKEKIRSGFLVSDVDAYPVLVRYTNINCGSIVIPEYWGNYLDYAPYTKVHVYLPFIGIVELEADDIIGHSVNINYAIDSYTGACIAQITVAKNDYVNTLYEFQGNCAVEVPITGGSQAAIKAGLITAAAYGITGLIGTVGNVVSGTLGGAALGTGGMIAGGILGGLEGLGQTAANAVNNVVSLKSSVQHSGTFGSSFGAMGIKKPYIIVKRPIQKVVPGYNQDYGYPAHKQVVIGQCQGYLKVLEINVVSPTATNDEKAQIEALLKQGVYVS